MKRMIIGSLVAVIMLFLLFPESAMSEGIGYNAGFDYSSNYFWRGYDWYGPGVGVFFPYFNVNLGDSGLSIGYLGEYPAELLGDGPEEELYFPKNWYGADFGVTYTKSIDKKVTITAKVWYMWYYKSKSYDKDGLKYNESFATGTLSVSIDALPLSPTIIYNHDYLVDDYDGNREKAMDYYVQFQFKHVVSLTPEASVTLQGGVGYYNQKSAEIDSNPDSRAKKGFSDVSAMADLSVTKGMVTVHGSINYAYVPDDDFNNIGDDKHRWWSSFGASIAF